MKHKRKIVNRFLSTLKNFFSSYKNTIKKVRRQASDWKKIFTIYIYLIKDFFLEYVMNSYNSLRSQIIHLKDK